MASLTPQTPPAVTEIKQWVLDSPAGLRLLRSSLHEALTGHPLAEGASLDHVPENMVLVATELATNALRHGLPPTIVRLGRAADCFVLDVADHAPSSAPAIAESRPPGAGGLGLRLVEQFADGLGWYVLDDTKHVWAEFPAADG